VPDQLPLFPESASTISQRVDALFLFLCATSIFFSALICVLVIVFASRYRRSRKGALATHIEGSLPLEILWSAVPFGVAMFMFAWGAKLYFDTARPPAGALEITVTAKQWMWKLQHPEGPREINELHVPLGLPVRLSMTSEDVIHAFYVPAFRIKRDVLPGRTSIAWFEATKTGQFHLFCAEYCGTKHSAMIGTIHVLEPLEYERWLAGAPAGESPVAAGERLFSALRCITCHSGQPDARGPDLKGILGRQVPLADGSVVVVDEDFVRQSILEPNAHVMAGFAQPSIMPTFKGQVSEEQIQQLIAYLRSTGGEKGGQMPGEVKR
jgi:cytochrome c oxidase subunit II